MPSPFYAENRIFAIDFAHQCHRLIEIKSEIHILPQFNVIIQYKKRNFKRFVKFFSKISKFSKIDKPFPSEGKKVPSVAPSGGGKEGVQHGVKQPAEIDRRNGYEVPQSAKQRTDLTEQIQPHPRIVPDVPMEQTVDQQSDRKLCACDNETSESRLCPERQMKQGLNAIDSAEADAPGQEHGPVGKAPKGNLDSPIGQTTHQKNEQIAKHRINPSFPNHGASSLPRPD